VAAPASRDGSRPVSSARKPALETKKTPAPQSSKEVSAPKSTAVTKPVLKGKSVTKSEAQPKPASRQSDVDPPLPKTNLTDKQLAVFKEMLLDKRRELLGDVRTLTKDALGRSRQDSSGDLSSMPIHMADLGTDNWEQDFTLGLIANEQQLVREIDEALQRIEEKTYGMCLATHKPISIARLKAKPWAKHCIEYARQRELGRY
jgi:RNA polymerase-binding protein DksA